MSGRWRTPTRRAAWEALLAPRGHAAQTRQGVSEHDRRLHHRLLAGVQDTPPVDAVLTVRCVGAIVRSSCGSCNGIDGA
jgi:hypothetical protein